MHIGTLYLKPSVCEFHMIIKLVVFIQQPYSKLDNSKITCLIVLKFSGKMMHFHKIRLKFGCKK